MYNDMDRQITYMHRMFDNAKLKELEEIDLCE